MQTHRFAVSVIAGLLAVLTGCRGAPAPPSSQPPGASPSAAESACPSSEAPPAFFTVPEMDEAQQACYDESVRPLLLTGLLTNDWSAGDVSAISPDPAGSHQGSFLMFAFEDLLGPQKMQSLWDQYGPELPAGEVETVLLARFPFSTEQLHEILSHFYRADQNIYHYEGGRGGGPIEGAVTAIREGESGAMLIDYAIFTWYSDERSTPEKEAYLNRTRGTLMLAAEGGATRYEAVRVGEVLSLA